MRSKKVITLLISLTLLVSIAIPGTLAFSDDQEAVNSRVTFTSGDRENPAPAPEEQKNRNDSTAPVNPETSTETENTCTCGSTDGTHTEGCPMYVAPEASGEPENTCTCGTTDGTHMEGCPLYAGQIESSEEVEIKYQVVGPENCGTLDSQSEHLPLPIIDDSVTAIGATPIAAEGFRFAGWYKDEACTQTVDASWVSDNKLIPGKTKNYGSAEVPVMGYEAATYYARFESETASLTISRQSSSEETNENQNFIFDVTGPNGYCKRIVINGSSSVTIKGLMAGEYTIKEVIGWSWRYRMDSSPKKITLQPAMSGKVDFSSTQNEQGWLSGDAYKKITFGD